MQRRVNRFTFDTHSVVLFSALVLTSAVSAGSPVAARNAQLSPVSVSSVMSQTARPAATGQSVLASSTAAARANKAGHKAED